MNYLPVLIPLLLGRYSKVFWIRILQGRLPSSQSSLLDHVFKPLPRYHKGPSGSKYITFKQAGNICCSSGILVDEHLSFKIKVEYLQEIKSVLFSHVTMVTVRVMTVEVVNGIYLELSMSLTNTMRGFDGQAATPPMFRINLKRMFVQNKSLSFGRLMC